MPCRTRAVRWSLPLVVVMGVCTAVIAFGPLDPPAGPVAPSYKTLSEVEPRVAVNATSTPGDDDSLFRIALPGSYYLTGNINGVAGKHGVEIAASGVTLDLNGFDLVGVAGGGFFSGVTVAVGGLSNIAVVNGSVRNWSGEAGVDLAGVFGSSNTRVENVQVSGNAGAGISTGSGATVRNCSAYLNAGNGIRVLNGAVSHCTAFNNVASGISVGTGCTVADCVARLNTLDGVRCANQCVIRDNMCSENGAGAGSGAGIHVTGADNRIEGNTCSGADRGIDVDAAGNIVVRNTCTGNAPDWEIAANNVVGPIIDRRAPGSAAIGGFTAPDSTGSTHPNANFSY